MLRRILIAAIGFCLSGAATAMPPTPPGHDPSVTETPAVIIKLRHLDAADLSRIELADIVVLLADPAHRPLVEEAIREKNPFPARAFIPLLRHPMLAVRLGALQLLEDHAGENFGYDAWAEAPGANKEAMARWEAWADGRIPNAEPVTNAETLAGFLNDLLSDDTIRSARGFRALMARGESAADAIAEFETLNPGLTPAHKSQLREVHLAIALQKLSTPNAESLAHRLVFGNLDTRLQGLAALAALGARGAPLLETFLDSPEPLEREAAIDGILLGAGAAGIPAISPRLHTESDPNVLHIALRRLGGIGGPEAEAILRAHLTHENEDIVIVSLEGLAKAKAADSKSDIVARLEDPRWRVRVAAIKAVAALKITDAGESLQEALGDPDEFVRISAVDAVAELRLAGAQAKLEELFLAEDALKPAIAASFARMNIAFPDTFVTALAKAAPEVALAVLDSQPDADAANRPLIRWALAHENDDIACAAIRLVASSGLNDPENAQALIQALSSENPRRMQSVLQTASLPRNEVVRKFPAANMPNFSPAGEPARDPLAPDPGFLQGFVEAFGKMLRSPSGGPLEDFREAVRRVWAGPTDPDDRIHAGILLIESGDPEPLPFFAEHLPELSAPQRQRLASALSVQRTMETRPLFVRLLDDPDAAVRDAAIDAVLADGAESSCVDLLFDVLQMPGSHLRARELFHNRLRSSYSLRSAPTAAYRARYLRTLAESSDPAVQVLVLALLGKVWTPECLPAAEPFTRSENPFVRRAAAYAIGSSDREGFQPLAETLAHDSSPWVRAVVPAVFMADSFFWEVPFAEDDVLSGYEGESESRAAPGLDAKTEALLRQLTQDPDPHVRVSAGLCLFTNLAEIDGAQLAQEIRNQPVSDRLAHTVEQAFRKKAPRMPDAYAPLAALLNGPPDDPAAKAAQARFPQCLPEPTPTPHAALPAPSAAPPS